MKLQVYSLGNVLDINWDSGKEKEKEKEITHRLIFLQVQRVNKGKGFEAHIQKKKHFIKN